MIGLPVIAMPSDVADPPSRRSVETPAIVRPGPRQVSFGDVVARVSPETSRAVLLVDGEKRAEKAPGGTRVRFTVPLPRRNATMRLIAYGASGRIGHDSVGPVFGLPRAARPHGVVGHLDARLQRRLRRLTSTLGGITAFYVESLDTGAGAGWNARARFPAASTVKLAIALAVLREHRGIPGRATRLDGLLRRMLVVSDNAAANQLLVRLGGSQTGGAAHVDAMLRQLGLRDTFVYSGYLLGTASAGKRIPLNVVASPSFSGKYTTAWDLARLHRDVDLATVGRGPLVRRLAGVSPAEARYLLFLLCHSADRGKLDRFVRGPGVAVPHKAGWISTARHDAGIVYWPGGAFVAAVMTWNGAGITGASDRLAGLVARAALNRYRALAERQRRLDALGTSVS